MRPLLYQSDKVRIWERFGKPPLVEELLPHPVGGPAHATWQPAELVAHVARGSRPLAHAQTLADIWRVINQFPDQALEEARCLPR